MWKGRERSGDPFKARNAMEMLSVPQQRTAKVVLALLLNKLYYVSPQALSVQRQYFSHVPGHTWYQIKAGRKGRGQRPAVSRWSLLGADKG